MSEQALVIGGQTLLGREVQEVLEDAGWRVALAEPGESSILTARDEEVEVIPALSEEGLQEADVLILAGSHESSRQAYELARRRPEMPVIDVSGALEDRPEARLEAPWLESRREPGAGLQVIAHPGALMAGLVLRAMHEAGPLSRAVVHIFEPASERGKAGVEELQQQVTSLLSFQPLPRAVFDAQLGFNLLARYGEQAPQSLESVEERICRHLVTLLGRAGVAPLPSVRLIQAPVFHGYSMSVWAQFAERREPEQVMQALEKAGVEVRGSGHEAPTNVGIAGQSQICAGVIEQDRMEPSGLWLWAVGDNLRLAADAALEAARRALRLRQ